MRSLTRAISPLTGALVVAAARRPTSHGCPVRASNDQRNVSPADVPTTSVTEAAGAPRVAVTGVEMSLAKVTTLLAFAMGIAGKAVQSAVLSPAESSRSVRNARTWNPASAKVRPASGRVPWLLRK